MLKTSIRCSLDSLMLVVMLGCSNSSDTSETSKDNTKNSPEINKAEIIGQVNSDSGTAGVVVSIGSQSTTTDSNGLFVLKDLELNAENRWIVEFSKDDYVTTQKIVESNDDQLSYSLNVIMTLPDVTKLVDLTQEQAVNLNQNQLSIVLPANSVNGGDENSSISLTYGDPSSARGKELFPGDYSATNDLTESADIILESIGFMDISITSETGQDLSELSEPADVTLRLPAIYQTGGEKEAEFSHGDSIAWWSYNEIEGTWLREDADPSTEVLDDAMVEEVEGVLYAKAKITHFSWWNVDRPIEEHACVSVKVVDSSGNPKANRPVFAEGISFQFTDTALTNSQGIANLTVKRTLDINNPETFKLYTNAGSATFNYPVTSLDDGIVSTDVLYSPATIGSTISAATGTCKVLSGEISTELKGTINATVKNQDDTPVANVLVYSSLGDSAMTDDAGMFSFKVPLNSSVYIIIPEHFSKSYITTEANKTITVDIVLANQSPVITLFKLTPNTGIKNGDSIVASAQATDPEGDELTYTWSATHGSFSSFNDSTVNWTAPLEAGSGEITLTVKDSENNEVIRSSFVSWSDAGSVSEEFTVRARIGNDVANTSDIEGITVVLHGIDKTSIEQTLITDENGIANFGQLSRDRVTVTIIEEYTDADETFYDVQTFIDIENRPISLEVENDGNSSYIDCNVENGTDARVKFINIPENTDYIWAVGLEAPIFGAEEGVETTVKVCPEYYNNPDNFMVAIARLNNNGVVLGHSQPVYSFVEGGVTTFNLSRTMIEIPIVSHLDYPVNVGVYSIDESLQYLGSYSSLNFESIKVMDVDIDNYYFHANNAEDDELTYNISWSTDELPASIVINNPDFGLSNIGFDASDREFTWDIVSNNNADLISATLESSNVYWNIGAPASTESIRIPQLPIAYDAINIDAITSKSVDITDWQSVNGYDALVEYIFYDDDNFPTFLDLFKGDHSTLSYELGRELQ